MYKIYLKMIGISAYIDCVKKIRIILWHLETFIKAKCLMRCKTDLRGDKSGFQQFRIFICFFANLFCGVCVGTQVVEKCSDCFGQHCILFLWFLEHTGTHCILYIVDSTEFLHWKMLRARKKT